MKIRIKTLLEGELEKAQLQLAARDMVDQLQDMVAKLTKLKVEELPALKEGLRSNIDNETATQFDSAVGAALQSAVDALTQTKDQVDQASLAISGDGGMPTGTDGIEQAMDLGGEEGAPEGGEEPPPAEEPEEPVAPAADSAAGGEKPLGRSKRESRERKMKAMIESLERRIAETKKAKKKMLMDKAKKKK